MSVGLWRVFWHELRRNIARKGYLFATFGVPVLGFVASLILPALFAGAASMPSSQDSGDPMDVNLPSEIVSQEGVHAGYIDLTGRLGDVGSMADQLAAFPDEAAAQAALSAGEIDSYYIIAEDYFETGAVTQVLPRMSITQISPDLIEQFLLAQLAQDVDPDVFARLEDPAAFQDVDVQRNTTEESETAFDRRFIVVYIFAIILLGSLFTTNGYLMQSVIEEKETRLIEILLSTLRPFELLGGKIAAMGLLGLLQIAVWTGAFLLVGWLSLNDNLRALLPILGTLTRIIIPFEILPFLFLYFLLGYLLFASLFGIVGALSNSMREGPQYTVVFVIPAILPFYFISVFATTPNSPLAVILSIFPLTAPLSMAQRLAVTNVPTIELLISYGLLAVTVVGVMWLAGRLFRVGTLLAGHPPKLRDLPRLIKG